MSLIKLPGFIDIHVHLRDPGQTYKEDFYTGTQSSIAGGFTTVLDMPNNLVPVTSLAELKKKFIIAKKKIIGNVGFYAGSLGDNAGELKKMEPFVFGLKLYLNKTTGNFIINAKNLEKIFSYWNSKKPILVHAEEDVLDIVLNVIKKTGKKVHICHVSNKVQLDLIIKAKQNNLPVTCGVTPHHLFLTAKDIKKIGTLALMKPSLASHSDQDFIWKNLNYVDVIESDHAPHTIVEKKSSNPPFGVPGLETTLPLLFTAASEGRISINRIIELCYENPKKIFNIQQEENTYIEVDLKKAFIIENKDLKTKCGWSPFTGRKVRGKVIKVFIAGKKVYDGGKFLIKGGEGKLLFSKNTSPYFDPLKSYEENYKKGPFGFFADRNKIEVNDKPKDFVFGIPVASKFGIPAGPLLNGKFVKAALDHGFDIVTYKTVRSREYPCSPFPNVLGVQVDGDLTLAKAEKGLLGNNEYNQPISITNSFGVPSFPPRTWQKDLSDSVKYAKRGQLVIGSFQGTINKNTDLNSYIQDFIDTANMVKKTGVKVIEVNLSCPNEGTSHLLCFDIDRTEVIVKGVKNQIGKIPLIIKIAYFEEQKQLEKLIDKVGNIVDGIAAINTIPAKIFNDQGLQALPGEGRLRAGVCGFSIKWAGLEMVKKLFNLRKSKKLKYAIFGVGGVTTTSDYFEYKKAGADVVLSATGSMWNPYLALEIKEKLSFN